VRGGEDAEERIDVRTGSGAWGPPERRR